MKAVITEYGGIILGTAGAAGMIKIFWDMFLAPDSMLRHFIDVWGNGGCGR